MILLRDRAGQRTDAIPFPKGGELLFHAWFEQSPASGEQLDPAAHTGNGAAPRPRAPGRGCARGQRVCQAAPHGADPNPDPELAQLWGHRQRRQHSPASPSPRGPAALTNRGRSLLHRATGTTKAAHTHPGGTLQRPDAALDIGSRQEAGAAVPGSPSPSSRGSAACRHSLCATEPLLQAPTTAATGELGNPQTL